MSGHYPFDIVTPGAVQTSGVEAAQEARKRRQTLSEHVLPQAVGSHEQESRFYRASRPLSAAINTALAVGAPLLLTGEPGTGKTQAAYFLSRYFGAALYPLHVNSTTTHKDLLYRFDTVAYFHATSDPQRKGERIFKLPFITKGPLWQAFEDEHPSVVLIDEIDKAPRDFPNDLLHVLDQFSFKVPELKVNDEGKEDDEGKVKVVARTDKRRPPIVVITSNSERRLPEPFLRRCIFHHIGFTPELVNEAVEARLASGGQRGAFPGLDEQTRKSAIDRFWELRGLKLRKPPATAELLVWLTVLSAKGYNDASALRSCALGELPALCALIKDRDDLSRV